jgi:hypothetical protein
MERLPTVSAMFLTRGRAQLLERALCAVLDDPATSEVVVVVDGDDPPTDDLLEGMARADSRLRVTRMPSPGTEGLDATQRGREHGTRLSDSDVVLALDDDVIAAPGLVRGHARWHARRDDAVVVGYMPVVTPHRWPWSHAPIRFYADAYEAHCEEYRSRPDSILHNLWGGNISLRRGRWLEVTGGGRVPCYLDDKEFGLLCLRHGLVGVFDPALRGDHWYQRSLRGFIERAEKTPAAERQLRRAYPDLLDPEPRVRLRIPVRLLIWLARPSIGWNAVRWSLIAAISVAAALRLRPLEDAGARLAWRVATERSGRAPEPHDDA